jgi:hypothetical protein
MFNGKTLNLSFENLKSIIHFDRIKTGLNEIYIVFKILNFKALIISTSKIANNKKLKQ